MKIFIYDHLNPEDNAMLQALYSRSAASVEEHIKKVEAVGSGKFMQSYYVGYNHKSIADCGSTTIFFEGISTLAAKAIQDWPLYSGQETSTRYIDMAKQPIIDPIGTTESRAILDRWMAFYTSKQDQVAEHVRIMHPRGKDEDEKVYASAVKARTFDIMRGFLPAGITTQASWHTNLRQAGDHLATMDHHPLGEVRDLATHARIVLCLKYPSSGFDKASAGVSAIKNDAAQDAWAVQCAMFAYHDDPIIDGNFVSDLDPMLLDPYSDLLDTRPRGSVIPHFIASAGNCHFDYYLDFGSFRDIQRHRNGVCRMPLLTTRYGFERWYIDQIDDALKYVAEGLIEQQTNAIAKLDGSDFKKQYYTALGFRVPCRLDYALPATVYVMELRSSRTVHPTLRRAVLGKMVKPFRFNYPQVRLHIDESLSDWDIRRGRQTITEVST
jgi:hypothetical protein